MERALAKILARSPDNGAVGARLWGQAEALFVYVRSKRRLLAELEEAHARSVYGPVEYSRGQARLLVEAAGEVIRLLKRVEEEVLPGA